MSRWVTQTHSLRATWRVLTGAAVVAALLCAGFACAEGPARSKLVAPGRDGRLVYHPYTDRGDRIPDFSTCGYRGGGVPLPAAPVKATLSPEPGTGDDLPRIQAAVDQVSKLTPDKAGLRGAVLLRKGRYRLGGTLRVAAGGVVLRGEGSGEDGTVLVATLRKQHTLIRVAGEGSTREVAGSRQAITDDYVPVGARTVSVADASRFRPGDEVIVHRPSTAEWIAAIGMDRIPMAHSKVVQWKPGSKDLRFQRVVTAVEGSRVTLDTPLVNALQKEYGGGSLYKYTFPQRIEEVGIESLRGDTEYDESKRDRVIFTQPADEEHAWDFIVFDRARHGWVRDVTAVHFGYSCVGLGRFASHVTVRDCRCLDPVSQVTGSRRYSFWISGECNLVERCRTRFGRHDFVMHSVVPGPNVFVDCTAENAFSDTGPHHRWSTGTLYDNVVVKGNAINVQDRGPSGTGHGWAGAQMVFWNCTAVSITCQQPPTAQNFAIGCTAKKRNKPPDGWWESPNQPVEPRSLYRTQLEERLGQ